MVKAIIDISEEANDILNVIKATNKLRTKSEAIETMTEQWIEGFLDRPLKTEFIRRMKLLEKRGKTEPYREILE